MESWPRCPGFQGLGLPRCVLWSFGNSRRKAVSPPPQHTHIKVGRHRTALGYSCGRLQAFWASRPCPSNPCHRRHVASLASVSHKDTCQQTQGLPGWSHLKILNFITSAETSFPNKVTVTGSGVKTQTYLLGASVQSLLQILQIGLDFYFF